MWLIIDGNINLPFDERYVLFESASDCYEELKKRGWENPLGLGFANVRGMKIQTEGGKKVFYQAGDVDLGVMRIEPRRCSVCKHGTALENALVPCDHG